MIYSMTAYAQCELKGEWGSLCWHIRSVNHRYLEMFYKLPEELRDIESFCREAVKGFINRGKLDCTLRLDLNQLGADSLNINLNEAKKIIRACQEIAVNMSSPGLVSPLQILSWPSVVQTKDTDWDIIRDAARQGLQTAIKQLKTFRQREGEKVAEVILQRLMNMESQVEQIKGRLPEVLIEQKAKLLANLKEIDVAHDEGRLEQELVYLAQKIDVAEEIDRLCIHINEAKQIFKKGGVIGRRLDFLMQEMNRETNTLASKNIASTISLITVELKVLIEQIREQVQNLE